MEPIGEGKALENPSVPHKKMVLETAESREHRLCRFMPGHSRGEGCHSAWGSEPCKSTAESCSLEGEVEPGVVGIFCAHTEDRGTKGIHNRKAPWRRGQFLTRSDVIS